MPDYLRLYERTSKIIINEFSIEPKRSIDTTTINKGSVTVISRNKGWLTVDPETMSRKFCLDKKLKGDLHKASEMSPEWMQTKFK